MSRFVWISDTFMLNRKIKALDDSEFRVWMRVLCMTVMLDDPHVGTLVDEIAGLTPETVKRLAKLGLLDGDSLASYVVHDWSVYNGGTVPERVEAYLLVHPDATANEIAKAIPARRTSVLNAVKRHRENGGAR
jgi:hypothetical protein